LWALGLTRGRIQSVHSRGVGRCRLWTPRLQLMAQYLLHQWSTYFTNGRGVEALGSIWTFLDLTPFGRQGEWEDSPVGWPQSPPYQLRA
jgi:hypothetical protein